ncbi:indolepyruvate ferredoxin oxidoreductase subunit alpha [Fredinandcohnia humi]
MAYVITSPCQDEKAAECVEVCPVECIEQGADQYYINGDICIDCGACVSACPVDAIFHEEEVPDDEVGSIAKAREFFG